MTSLGSSSEDRTNSFKNILLSTFPSRSSDLLNNPDHASSMNLDEHGLTQETPGRTSLESEQDGNTDTDNIVLLSEKEKQRIYRPWAYSVIIKLLGKKLSHQYIKNRLGTLWRPT